MTTIQSPMKPPDGGSSIAEFRRAPGAQAGQGIGAGIGAFLFLGMAALFLVGFIPADLPIRVFAALGFGFFGLLMGSAAVAAATRGGDGRVAEVGPDGLWLPETGLLPWADIAEVRLERIRGVGSSRAPVTRQFLRLGVVPRDPSMRPRTAVALATRMTSAYLGLIRMLAPDVRLGGDEPAPFGVAESDLPKDFERLLEAVREHVDVIDAADARVRRVAGPWSSRSDGGTTQQQEQTPTEIQAIVAARASAPRGSFSVPAVRPLEVVFSIVPIVALLAIFVPVALPMLLRGGSTMLVVLAVFGFFAVLFVVPAVVQFVRLVARMRERPHDADRLRVGPEGIWTRGSGLVPWPDVRAIRTERAGFMRQAGSTRLERWRLTVATATGVTAAVTSDELDARFDTILDLVRNYHPVVETS